MPFTFANINERSALVQGETFFDLATITQGAVSSDAMEAIQDSDLLHHYAAQLDDYEPSGIIADGCDEVCEIHTWARGRFTSRLPGNPPRKQREVNVNSDIDDLMGTIVNASDDSDDGSGEELEGNAVSYTHLTLPTIYSV